MGEWKKLMMVRVVMMKIMERQWLKTFDSLVCHELW